MHMDWRISLTGRRRCNASAMQVLCTSYLMSRVPHLRHALNLIKNLRHLHACVRLNISGNPVSGYWIYWRRPSSFNLLSSSIDHGSGPTRMDGDRCWNRSRISSCSFGCAAIHGSLQEKVEPWDRWLACCRWPSMIILPLQECLLMRSQLLLFAMLIELILCLLPSLALFFECNAHEYLQGRALVVVGSTLRVLLRVKRITFSR